MNLVGPLELPPGPPAPLFWLSFVDRLASDHGCLNRACGAVAVHLGVCIVHGHDIGAAIEAVWLSDCNPGGEVLGCPVDARMPEHLTYRLLTEPGAIVEAQAVIAAGTETV
jgi:hypothetical protein